MNRRDSAILVVEDDPDLRTLVGRTLSGRGYAVEEAADVAGALATLDRLTPDAIVTDVMMPGASGLDLVRALRTNPGRAHIPVLILSARDQVGDVLAGYDRGADEYVTKPIQLAVLVAKLETLLHRTARARTAESSGGTAPATVVAFEGAAAGSGTTTLAAAFAALAAAVMEYRTGLLDLDPRPRAAAMLGAAPHATIADVGAAGSDGHGTLARLLAAAGPHLGVVTAARGEGPDDLPSPALLTEVVGWLRERSDLLVVDVPGPARRWTGPDPVAADVTCLVTGPQRPAIEALRTDGVLDGPVGSAPSTLLVVNRLVEDGLDAYEIQRVTGREPAAVVPYSQALLQLGSGGWEYPSRQAPDVLGQLAGLVSAVLGAAREGMVSAGVR